MEQKAVLEAIVKALDSKRAEDIQVIGVKNLTILGDYFVIANQKRQLTKLTILYKHDPVFLEQPRLV